MSGTQPKQSKLGDLRPELFTTTKLAVCQCVVEHIGYHGFDPVRKETWLALSMKTDYEETQNLKRYNVRDCPNHADKDKILRRIDEFKSNNKPFSMKSETDDGLSSCSIFPEHPSSYDLKFDIPVLPKIEHLEGK